MVGDELMIAPVLKPMIYGVNSTPVKNASTAVDVYLPQGTTWIDFWTGRVESGGRTIKAVAPLSRSPLFVKAGAILPLGPRVQYSGEKPAAPIELRVYPGADGSYSLYEDAGDGWGYQKGEFSVIPISWNNKTRQLGIGAIRGGFPGMLKEREFHIVLVTPDQGTGLEPTAKPNTVRYNGRQVSLKLHQ